MTCYAILNLTITDRVKVEELKQKVPATLVPFGGEYLVRGGEGTVMEGAPPHPSHLIIRFPDRAKAEGWYNSAAYQALTPLRQSCTEANFSLVDGIEA